jgi:hypothetical protein
MNEEEEEKAAETSASINEEEEAAAVVITFVNNILDDKILHTVLHVPNAAVHAILTLLIQLRNFKIRCSVFSIIQLLRSLLVSSILL